MALIDLSIKQIRKLFNEIVGKKLTDHGFICSDNTYYRLHRKEYLLRVYLTFYHGGGFDIEYGHLPFCIGAKSVNLVRRYRITSGLMIDNHPAYGIPEVFTMPYSDMLDREINSFMDLIFYRFVSIDSMVDMVRFLEYIGVQPSFYEYIHVQQYDLAIRALHENIEFERRNIDNNERILSEYAARFHRLDSGKMKKNEEALIKRTKEIILGSKSAISDYSTTICLLQANNSEWFERLITENCEITDDTCKRELAFLCQG